MDPNVEAVIAKHRSREKQGLQKYGVDTTRADLSATEWLSHLQEELMDAAVYAERLLQEAAEGEEHGKRIVSFRFDERSLVSLDELVAAWHVGPETEKVFRQILKAAEAGTRS